MDCDDGQWFKIGWQYHGLMMDSGFKLADNIMDCDDGQWF